MRSEYEANTALAETSGAHIEARTEGPTLRQQSVSSICIGANWHCPVCKRRERPGLLARLVSYFA